MMYHEGRRIDLETGKVVWRQEELVSQDTHALQATIKEHLAPALRALRPVCEAGIRACVELATAVRRAAFTARLSRWMPYWLARIVGRRCPRKWLPALRPDLLDWEVKQ